MHTYKGCSIVCMRSQHPLIPNSCCCEHAVCQAATLLVLLQLLL